MRLFAVPYCNGFWLNGFGDESDDNGLVSGLKYSPLYNTARELAARSRVTLCRDAFFVES